MTLAITGCRSESQEQTDAATAALPVTFVEAEFRPVEDSEEAIATVRAKHAPRIAAQIEGVVTEIHVDEGDEVDRGDRLAEMDRTDYEIERRRAGAEASRLEVLIAQKKREIERHKKLREGGHTPASHLEDLESEHAALTEELAAAESEFERADRDLARTAIRAPYGGVIAAREVSEGDFVEAGTELFNLSTNSLMQARIPLPESVGERLEPGLEVRLARGGDPGTGLVGQITHISPQVEGSSRSVTVIAEFQNQDGWRTGSSLNAEVILEERESIVVPAESVVRRPAGLVVYVVEAGEALERPVRTGRTVESGVEIVDGLGAGEHVVLDGAGFLSDGAAVKATMHGSEPSTEAAGAAMRGY